LCCLAGKFWSCKQAKYYIGYFMHFHLNPWATFETRRGCSWNVRSLSRICVSFCHVAFVFLKLYLYSEIYYLCTAFSLSDSSQYTSVVALKAYNKNLYTMECTYRVKCLCWLLKQ